MILDHRGEPIHPEPSGVNALNAYCADTLARQLAEPLLLNAGFRFREANADLYEKYDIDTRGKIVRWKKTTD
jgi:hypothetical protein